MGRRSLKSVVVIGGGIIGLCCAYYLQKDGHEVTLLDEGPEDSQNCSTGNSGLIVPSHFIPLASPGMIQYGLSQMMHDGSAFGVRSPFDSGFLKWAKLFAIACKRNKIDLLAPLLMDAHLASKALYLEMEGDSNQGFAVRQNGLYMLCHSNLEMEEEAESLAFAGKLGVESRMADANEIQNRFPGISSQIKGGAYFPGDASIDPDVTIDWLRNELKTKVDFRFRSPVNAFDLNASRVRSVITGNRKIAGDQFIIATGSSLQSSCRMLNAFVPIQSGKGYSITLEVPSGVPTSSCIDGSARLAITPIGGKVRFGGTMEIGGSLERVNEERFEKMKSSIQTLFPELSQRSIEEAPIWGGLRPLSPDGLPYIGKLTKSDNVHIAGGHSMMGMSLGPITGKLISEQISGENPSLSLEIFNPNRYD